MSEATIIERNGRETTGTLLYVHSYPHAVRDDEDKGRVARFERRPQRVGLLTAEGEIWHFTVPREVHCV